MARPSIEITNASNWLAERAKRTALWMSARAAELGTWASAQAKDLWRWSKKHPILATMLIAGTIAAAFFPPLYALLPALPYVGPFVLSLIASAPYWAAPITFAATVISTAIASTAIYLMVSLSKKLFGGGLKKSLSKSSLFDDKLETDSDYIDDQDLRKNHDFGKKQAAAVQSDKLLHNSTSSFEIVDPGNVADATKCAPAPETYVAQSADADTTPITELNTNQQEIETTMATNDGALTIETAEPPLPVNPSLGTSPHAFHRKSISQTSLSKQTSIVNTTIADTVSNDDTCEEDRSSRTSSYV